MTTNLGIHTVNYSTTLLSLLCLTLIGNISVREPALLALGAVLIIAGNVGANIATNRTRKPD